MFYRTPSVNGRIFLALWVVIMRWMSGLREMPRLKRYNIFTRLLLFAWLFLRPVSSTHAADNFGWWVPTGVAYTVAVLLLLAASIGAETRAYNKVRAFLAAVPPDPTVLHRPTTPGTVSAVR